MEAIRLQTGSRHGRFSRLVRALVLLTLAAVALQTWFIRGLFVSFEVHGGSMAPTLIGGHREVICGDCGYRFDCDADDAVLRGDNLRVVCPNCGCVQQGPGDVAVVSGDRVLVSRALYFARPPRRWELVAFQLPDDPRQACVKRIVGLPGESVRIRNGEVYIDGVLARKPLFRQRALAIPVYDANYPPKAGAGLPPRWQSERLGAWGETTGRFAHAWISDAASIDWLTYHHWQRLPGSAADVVEGPITNQCGYSQNRPLHPAGVHPVGDVMVNFRLVRVFGAGKLLIRATDGHDEFVVQIEPATGSYALKRGGATVLSGDGVPWQQNDLRVEVSLVDRQFILAIGGRQVVCYPFDPSAGQDEPTATPFSVGSLGLGIEIQDLRVFRDVYYTHPLGIQGRWGLMYPVSLGEGEYYVLGDNSPISADSRTWSGGPAVVESLLLGKPFLVSYPSWRLDLGPWHIQVPDPTEIRYIR